ncbi:spermatogenesis-associated serine-rich protein 2-like [Peromyscus leucopus]|uniref:spermatogenesis-associated serine-rich protein 2-like n=1 Tax=Peromyscus leucopus TaxID=10041 RepID=UPI00188502DB|nr:spermatogenesis-associated serine-rich protein 2-like [Peromyscus leucopus]
MDREVALLAEMDKVKAEAMEILLGRQKKAEVLKKMTDVAVRMSEEQLVELRADIKHFVSERKYDEDLGRVARFTCDVETLKQSIDSFGQVSHPKNSYSSRSRCSSVVSMSLSGPGDGPAASSSPCASVPSLPGANKRNCAPGETSAAVTNPVTGPARLIGRYFQATGEEDKATSHKTKRPLTPQTKGGMTVWSLQKQLVVFIGVPVSEHSTSGPRKLGMEPRLLCRDQWDWSQRRA